MKLMSISSSPPRYPAEAKAEVRVSQRPKKLFLMDHKRPFNRTLSVKPSLVSEGFSITHVDEMM